MCRPAPASSVFENYLTCHCPVFKSKLLLLQARLSSRIRLNIKIFTNCFSFLFISISASFHHFNKEIKEISLSDYIGKWVVFFWYPLDFTFVCPTEIIAFGDRQPEFSAINAQVI